MQFEKGQNTGDKGFAGRLNNIQLSDLIQMCCTSGISTVIQVRKHMSYGAIFIEDGEIVHADCGKITGMEAFYEIFSWQSGSFETLKAAAVPEATIHKNWQYLIMEGHRRMDEARAAFSKKDMDPDEKNQAADAHDRSVPEDCLKLSVPEIEVSRVGETARGPFRVLIVDDSAMMCRILTEILSSDENIQVVGVAENGEDALLQIERLRPDLITLDVNMPVMNGQTALKHIMIRNPCPVVIVSAVNERLESNIINFLLLGAVDYVQKPVRGEAMDRKRLTHAVLRAAPARTDRFRRAVPPGIVAGTENPQELLTAQDSLVLIFSGAGGYAELVKIIPLLPVEFEGALVVVQAMSPSFREPFAAYLDRRSHIRVRPLVDEAQICRGYCYLASDDRPFRLSLEGIRVVFGRNGGRDELFPGSAVTDGVLASAAEVFKDRLLTVLLSGADTGSLSGLCEIRKQGGRIISQDIRECLVPQPLAAAGTAGLISKAMGVRELVSEIVHFPRPERMDG